MPDERRDCPRSQLHKLVGFFADFDPADTFQQAFTVDLSVRGVRVQGEIDMCPGQEINMFTMEGETYLVPTEVAWVREMGSDGCREAGLRFLDSTAIPLAWLLQTAGGN